MNTDDRIEALEGVVKILLGVVYQDDKITTSDYRELYDRLCAVKPSYADLVKP